MNHNFLLSALGEYDETIQRKLRRIMSGCNTTSGLPHSIFKSTQVQWVQILQIFPAFETELEL